MCLKNGIGWSLERHPVVLNKLNNKEDFSQHIYLYLKSVFLSIYSCLMISIGVETCRTL
jgi:hypothetical protein